MALPGGLRGKEGETGGGNWLLSCHAAVYLYMGAAWITPGAALVFLAHPAQ
jgi:hypothetical protein